MYTIVIAVFDRGQPSTLAGIQDTFSLANVLLKDYSKFSGNFEPIFNVIIASETGLPVVDNCGKEIPVDCAIESVTHCNSIVLPGAMSAHHDTTPPDQPKKSTVNWLIDQHARGALVCALNSSKFILGDSGLLNHRECSVCPKIYHGFVARYPLIRTNYSDTVIIDKGVLTTKSLISWLEVTMKIIQYLAGDGAHHYFSQMVLGNQFQPSTDSLHKTKTPKENNRFLSNAEYAILQTQYQSVSVKELAVIMAISERTLSRKIKQLTGKTAKEFIDDTRIEYSCILLKNTNKQVKEIALSLGYSSDSVFRRIFNKRIGMTPVTYRKQEGKLPCDK